MIIIVVITVSISLFIISIIFNSNIISSNIGIVIIVGIIIYQYYYPSGVTPDRLYGNPKALKPTVCEKPKLRPIISSSGTTGHQKAIAINTETTRN